MLVHPIAGKSDDILGKGICPSFSEVPGNDAFERFCGIQTFATYSLYEETSSDKLSTLDLTTAGGKLNSLDSSVSDSSLSDSARSNSTSSGLTIRGSTSVNIVGVLSETASRR
jgi:hypothetical protein